MSDLTLTESFTIAIKSALADQNLSGGIALLKEYYAASKRGDELSVAEVSERTGCTNYNLTFGILATQISRDVNLEKGELAPGGKDYADNLLLTSRSKLGSRYILRKEVINALDNLGWTSNY